MAKKDEEQEDLKKIASSTFSRGLSVLGLTLSTGAKFAGHKISSALQAKEIAQEKFEKFLFSQAHVLVDELGRLKGSMMKAGQMLSIYGEHFFPEDVNKVLKKLQNQSKPLVWEEMDKSIRHHLGKDIHDKLEFNPKPIAAASMGQVYEAYDRKSGQHYAVKVQYPGVDKAIDSDLKALKRILAVSKIIPRTDDFDDVFKEVRMMLHYEVDYARELNMLETYRDLLGDDDRFVIPHVFRQYSGKRILTMSYEDGVKVDSEEVSQLSQERRNKLSASLLDLLFKETYQWRFMQTDPHFGNYKVRLGENGESDKFILLDFGAVRKFPKRYIHPLSDIVKAALENDAEKLIDAGVQLGFLREDDGDKQKDLFYRFCLIVVEAFSQEYASQDEAATIPGNKPYLWGETDLLSRAGALGKDAAFVFKLRPPPREAVFLDRKVGGVFIVLSKLKYNCGPRSLLLNNLELMS